MFLSFKDWIKMKDIFPNEEIIFDVNIEKIKFLDTVTTYQEIMEGICYINDNDIIEVDLLHPNFIVRKAAYEKFK